MFNRLDYSRPPYQPPRADGICPYFLLGTCHFGERCWSKHEIPFGQEKENYPALRVASTKTTNQPTPERDTIDAAAAIFFKQRIEPVVIPPRKNNESERKVVLKRDALQSFATNMAHVTTLSLETDSCEELQHLFNAPALVRLELVISRHKGARVSTKSGAKRIKTSQSRLQKLYISETLVPLDDPELCNVKEHVEPAFVFLTRGIELEHLDTLSIRSIFGPFESCTLDAIAKSCPNLEHLNLDYYYGNKARKSAPQSYKDLYSLQPPRGIDKMLDALPDLKTLYLQGLCMDTKNLCFIYNNMSKLTDILVWQHVRAYKHAKFAANIFQLLYNRVYVRKRLLEASGSEEDEEKEFGDLSGLIFPEKIPSSSSKKQCEAVQPDPEGFRDAIGHLDCIYGYREFPDTPNDRRLMRDNQDYHPEEMIRTLTPLGPDASDICWDYDSCDEPYGYGSGTDALSAIEDDWRDDYYY